MTRRPESKSIARYRHRGHTYFPWNPLTIVRIPPNLGFVGGGHVVIGAGCHPSNVENPIRDNLSTLRVTGVDDMSRGTDDDVVRAAGDALRAVAGMLRAAVLRLDGDKLRVVDTSVVGAFRVLDMRLARVGAVEMRESGIPKPIPKPVTSVSSFASASYGSGVRDRGGVYANVSNDFCVRGLGSGKGCGCWFGSWCRGGKCGGATRGLRVRRVLSEVRGMPSTGESDIVRLKSAEAVRLISSGDIRALCCSDVSSLDAPLLFLLLEKLKSAARGLLLDNKDLSPTPKPCPTGVVPASTTTTPLPTASSSSFILLSIAKLSPNIANFKLKGVRPVP